jgi:hypothetical protein
MADLRRPTREFSFSNHQRLQPNAPPPGNELDGMLHDLREAIVSTQEALAELRRDDGQLRNNLVGPEQLRSDLAGTLIGDIAKVTDALTQQVRNAITSQTITTNDISLLAKDAEAAAIAASKWLSEVKRIEARVLEVSTRSEVSSQAVITTATDAENWANYAEAQADNAEKSENSALAWAEYLAGPVVSGPDAPAYIAQSPFPRGLYYQPIEGRGGTGGLWSAKWWAVYCQQLVGWISSFYLGAWDHHPMPGEVHPITGMSVPNPIPPGSMYLNTTNNKLYIWTGEIWITPFSLTGGVTSRFTYIATAGQTVFSGPDLFGNEPETEEDTEHDVHVNGVKLTRDNGTDLGDYQVDNEAAELTLAFPVTADSVVQWDLLVSADDLRPGAAVIFKIDPIVPDGVTVTFQLTYMSGTLSPYITKPVELLVSVDGVIQEPYVDYSAIDDEITFYSPPGSTSRIWMIYFRSGNLTALTVEAAPAPVIILSDNRVLESAAVNTTIGTLSLINPHSGTPVYSLTDDADGLFKIVGNSLQVDGPLDFETAISHNITIAVTGIAPAAAPRTLSIVVQDVPEGIIGDIVLVGSSVSEDAIIGMTIGTLSVLNATGTPTFSLLNNAGGRFFVSGTSLRVAIPLTGPGTHLIVVAVTGVIPETASEAFVITVTPAEGTGDIVLTGTTIPEGSPIGTTVGTLTVTGTTGTPVYTLVENPGGKFAINFGNLLQVAAAGLDYETTPTIAITVAVGGVSPPAPSKEFTIFVTYVDTVAPTITSSSSVSNDENSILAHALTADEAIASWSIVGGADATRFEISGSTLRWLSNGVKDFEAPNDADANNQYIVQVRAQDAAGNNSAPQTITVTVNNVVEVSWLTFLGGTNTNINLTDSNVGVLPAAGGWALAVGSGGWKNSGKWYFESRHMVWGANGDHHGLVPQGYDYNWVTVNSPANVISIHAGGSCYARGLGGIFGIGSLDVGDYTCFAVDLDNWRFWARRNNGPWNNNASANPAATKATFEVATATNVTLSPNSLTATHSSTATDSGVRASHAKSSGKWYFEVTVNDLDGANDAIGFITQYGTYTNLVTNGTNCVAFYRGTGNIYSNGIYQTHTIGPIADGDIIFVAIDLDADKVWFRKTSGAWNGNNTTHNPDTGLGGLSCSNFSTTTLTPVVGFGGSGAQVGDNVTFNFGATAFVGTVPTGFNAGWTAPGGIGGIDISYYASTVIAPYGEFHQNSYVFGPAKWLFNFGATAFAHTVPSGFTAGWNTDVHTATGHPTYSHLTTIDPATASGWIEPGGQLFTKPGSASIVVRPDLSQFRNTGKYYVEYEWASAPSSNGDGPAFMCHDATGANVAGDLFAATGCAVYKNGRIFSNDVDTGINIGGAANTYIIGAAIDFANKRVWFRVNNGPWNGNASYDPAANTGGVSISNYVPAKAMGPAICSYSYPGCINVMNLGERPFVYGVPSGFTAGWPKIVDTGAPTITSSSSVSLNENAALALVLTANEYVTWSIVGGADQAQFELDASTNTLRFLSNGTRNFETPTDADANNVYVVQVRATDLSSNQTNQTINVTILNVADELLDGLSPTAAFSASRKLFDAYAGAFYTEVTGVTEPTVVSVAKDQSGNGRDLSQSDPVYRPFISASGPNNRNAFRNRVGSWYNLGRTPASDFVAAGSKYVVVSFIADAVTGNTGDSYGNDGVWGDGGGNFGLYLKTAAPISTTSYSNPGGSGDRTGVVTVTWDGTTGGGAVADLLDGSQTNEFFWTAGQTSKNLTFDFGTAKVIDAFKWYQDVGGSHGSSNKLQGSNDNVSYTDILPTGGGSTFVLGGTSTGTEFTFINSTAYRYYRITVPGATSASPYLREIEFKLGAAGSVTQVATSRAFNWDTDADVAPTGGEQITIGTPYVVEFRHEAGVIYQRINNGVESSKASGNSALTAAFRMFAGWGSSSMYFQGRIFELVTFSTSIPTAEQRAALVTNMGNWIGATIAPWTPAALGATVRAWYKTDTLTGVNGDPQGTITDQSGNGYTLTQTGTPRATLAAAHLNSLNTLRFTAANANRYPLSSAIYSGLAAGSIYMVVKWVSEAVNNGLFKFGSSASNIHWPYVDGVYYDDFGSNARKTMGNPSVSFTTDYRIISLYSATNDCAWYIDGGQGGSGGGVTPFFSTASNTVSWNTGSNFLGQDPVGGQGHDGWIAEVICCNGKQSVADRQKIEGYLAHKWGLAGNLSASHPYKTSRPMG